MYDQFISASSHVGSWRLPIGESHVLNDVRQHDRFEMLQTKSRILNDFNPDSSFEPGIQQTRRHRRPQIAQYARKGATYYRFGGRCSKELGQYWYQRLVFAWQPDRQRQIMRGWNFSCNYNLFPRFENWSVSYLTIQKTLDRPLPCNAHWRTDVYFKWDAPNRSQWWLKGIASSPL
jgi:hypothetical protein